VLFGPSTSHTILTQKHTFLYTAPVLQVQIL
jgi:hypothetical protein